VGRTSGGGRVKQTSGAECGIGKLVLGNVYTVRNKFPVVCCIHDMQNEYAVF